MDVEDYDITVIMPCYNAMPYIKEAIDSILEQTYTRFILYIVYDDSNDGTLEYLNSIRDPRVQVRKNEYGKGIVNARNFGLDIAITKYVALMDADDIAIRDRLAIEREFMEHNEDVGAVGGIMQTIDEKGTVKCINGTIGKTSNEVKSWLFFGNVCPNGTMMYRNSMIKNAKIRYRDDVMEDYLFWCNVANESKIVILPNLLLSYRVWPNNRSGTVLGGSGSEKRQIIHNKINDYMFTSNGFKMNSFQKKYLYRSIREGGTTLSVPNALINAMTYNSLVKQATKMNQEWSESFIYLCKSKRNIEIKQAIKYVVKAPTRWLRKDRKKNQEKINAYS